MERIVKKTAIITISALVGVTAAIILIFSVFFPVASGDFCRNSGLYGMASGFYLRVYEKSGKAEDFSRYMDCEIVHADSTENYKKLAAVGGDTVKYKDDLSADDYDYYSFWTVQARYELGDYDLSVTFAYLSKSEKAAQLAQALAQDDASYAEAYNRVFK